MCIRDRRFINEMKKCDELKDTPISVMGGIETWKDACEFLALGCENLQITTSVMQYGYRIIDDLINGLKLYLISNDYKSVNEIIGKALPNIVPADNLDRDSICYPRFDMETCIGCGDVYKRQLCIINIRNRLWNKRQFEKGNDGNGIVIHNHGSYSRNCSLFINYIGRTQSY